MNSETNAHEACRGAGDNLRFLLGAPADGEVLVIGRNLDPWRSYFPEGRFETGLHSVAGSGSCFGLILYHSGSASSRPALEEQLGILPSLLRNGGHLLFFGGNPRSAVGMRKRRNREHLDAAGLHVVKEFLGVPSHDFPEEMVVPGSRFLEPQGGGRPFSGIAKAWVGAMAPREGSIFLVSPSTIEDGTAARTAEGHIRKYLASDDCSCTVERIDFRQRGCLVLFIIERRSGKGFIARIVSDPESRKVVRGNADFLSFLRTSGNLGTGIKEKLPEPTGETEFPGITLFTETLIEGILAWKAIRPSLREAMFDSSSNFIFELQLAFRRKIELGEGDAEALFRPDMDGILACRGADRSVTGDAAEDLPRIRRVLARRECFLTVSHGDYGYGNILVDPASGRLTGVIDWDTGRRDDLPGVDYLNMAVQRVRIERKTGVAQAFESTCTSVLQRGSLDEGGFHAKEFGIEGDILKAVLHAGLIRYMGRAARYPEVFSSEQADYRKSLEWLRRMAPL